MIEVTKDNAAEAAKKVKEGTRIVPAKTLAEALARIYADGARYVQKTGQMAGFGNNRNGYSYARETDFIAALRPLLELHGVTIRPVQYEVLTNEVFERNGKAAYRAVVLATFEFMHSSGDKATAQAIGEGQDSGDKAFNKAMTGAMKYVLRQSFCTETGDDPDDTPSHEQERAPAKPAAVPQQKPANNPRARMELAEAYAKCETRVQANEVDKRVKYARDNGTIGDEDVAALRPVQSDTYSRLPK